MLQTRCVYREHRARFDLHGLFRIDAADAHRRMESNQRVGKVILDCA